MGFITKVKVFIGDIYDRISTKLTNAVIFLHLKKFFLELYKYQKWAAWGTSLIMGYSLNNFKEKNQILLEDTSKMEVFKIMLEGMHYEMNSLDWPMYKKLWMNPDLRLVALNDAYEIYYGVERRDLIGKSNIEAAGDTIGRGWRNSDLEVIKHWSARNRLEMAKLKDGTVIRVLSHKWPELELNDTVIYGVSVPLEDILEILRKENLDIPSVNGDSLDVNIKN